LSLPVSAKKPLAFPAIGRRLISLVVPPDEREFMLGDIEEEYRHRVVASGRRSARRWLRQEILRSVTLRWRYPRSGPKGRKAALPRGHGFMENSVQNFRYALRLIRRRPAFTAVTVLTLALGIGSSAAIFSVANAMLFRPLPYPAPDRLVLLSEVDPDGSFGNTSYATVTDWRARSKTLTSVAAVRGWSATLTGEQEPERLPGLRVSHDYFRILGVEMFLGRGFLDEKDHPETRRVVILGHDLWKRRFASDPDVVGKRAVLSETDYTVVGVLPPDFEPLVSERFHSRAEIWSPLGYAPTDSFACRTCRHIKAVGRIRPEVTLSEARAEMGAISTALAQEYPQDYPGPGVLLSPLQDAIFGDSRQALYILLAAVGFLLLIACANVAGLLLARASERRREIAVRSALGAGRSRLAGQLLTESALHAALAAALGLLLAAGMVRAIVASSPGLVSPLRHIPVDAAVLVFTMVVAVMTAVLFGLAPALQGSAVDVNQTLQEGGRGSAGGARARRFTRAMVVVQLTLTTVLLFGAGLMIRSFFVLYNLDLGVKTEGLLTLRLGLAEKKYPEPGDRIAFHERLAEALATSPGVESSAVASHPPMAGGDRRELLIEGRPADDAERAAELSVVVTAPRYFEALGIGARRGRVFRETDGVAGSESAMVNERFVSMFFPGEDPLGRRVRLREDGEEGPWLTLVGVVPTVRQRNFQELDPDAVVYVPYRQEPLPFVSVLARGRVSTAALTEEIRQAVQGVDPDLPVYSVRTLDEALAEARWPFRVFGSLFAIFALIALVMAGVGIYGVMAYAVSQRAQEIGVRMALGASRKEVSWLIVRQGLVELVLGTVLGLVGALAAGRVIGSLLVQVSTSDPVALAAVTLLLAGIAAAACLVPARRATRLDPVLALRTG
jgi:putative ABC transport system permease protein